ncbi:TolB family protein [Streptomyces nogalater]
MTSSRDGSVLVAEVQGVLWRVPPEGGEAVRITDWDLEATRPALSPDGGRLVVGGYRGGGFHLWTLRTDGSGLRQITDGPWDDRGPAWSSDGSCLVFASERGGDAVTGASFGLWTMDADGGGTVRLTGGAYEDSDPVWWPDGHSVVCVRAAHGRRRHRRRPGTGPGARRGGPAQVLREVGRDGCCARPSPLGPDRLPAPVRHHGLPVPARRAGDAPGGRPGGGRGEDPAAAPPCWLGDDWLLYVADGRLRLRALGAPGSVRDIPFTARMPVPRPGGAPNRPPWRPRDRCAASICPPWRPTAAAWPSWR